MRQTLKNKKPKRRAKLPEFHGWKAWAVYSEEGLGCAMKNGQYLIFEDRTLAWAHARVSSENLVRVRIVEEP